MSVGSSLVAARRTASALGVVALVVASAGCYTYRPSAVSAVAPGATVRTTLSTEAMIRLEEFFPDPQRTLVGEVVDFGEGDILLLTRTQTSGGPPVPTLPMRQRISVRHQEILTVEERVLDRPRTAALAGTLFAASAALVWHFLTGESKGSVPNQPPPGPDMAVVHFGLPLGGAR